MLKTIGGLAQIFCAEIYNRHIKWDGNFWRARWDLNPGSPALQASVLIVSCITFQT